MSLARARAKARALHRYIISTIIGIHQVLSSVVCGRGRTHYVYIMYSVFTIFSR